MLPGSGWMGGAAVRRAWCGDTGLDTVDIPGVAKHLVNFASLLLRQYLKFSECFWALLTVKYGRFFTLVLFGYRYEK